MAVDYAALWKELNTRQQWYLKTIFEEDQAREQARRSAAAAGEWDNTPAAQWRAIDAYHEPSAPRELVGITDLQYRWRTAGHHDQGTGATIKVLQGKRLIQVTQRGTRWGVMHQVSMTKRGRALMRWVTQPRSSGTKVKAPLAERPVEVLGKLYTASRSSPGYLDWLNSPSIDKHLIPRGLARSRSPGRGYEITEEGIAHLGEHHATYARAYPKLPLPHPAGKVGWPRRADQLLAELQRACVSLEQGIARATTGAANARAQAKAHARSQAGADNLVIAMDTEIDQLTRDQANALVNAYDRHRQKLEHALTERVMQYAAATLATVEALVAETDPVAAIFDQRSGPVEALPAYTPTGIASVDVTAEQFYAQCQRSRPATRTQRHAKAATGLMVDAVPSSVRGTALEHPWALAAHLHRSVREGYLYRLLAAEQSDEPNAP